MRCAAARPVQQLGERAVRFQIDRQDAAAVCAAAYDRGARAVAEQHRRRAITPIHDTGELLGGDHQHVLCLLGRDDSFGRAEGKDEPGAGRADVECRSILGAEDCLEVTGLRGKEPVG